MYQQPDLQPRHATRMILSRRISLSVRRRAATVLMLGAAILAAGRSTARADVYVADTTNQAIYKFTGSGAQTTFSSLGHPVGLTFDSAGNLYAGDSATGTIYEYPAAGGQNAFATGFTNILGLAFDASGNLFASLVDATSGAGSVVKITPAGVQTTFASGLNRVRGLAFDGAGNLYVADLDAGDVYKYTPDGTQSIFASGFNYPTGLAFDTSGNLFVCSQGVGVFEITPAGAVSTFTTNVTDPRWLAFDATGNLYVTDVGDASGDSGQGSVYVFTPAGDRSTFASGLSYPTGVAVSTASATVSTTVSVEVDLTVIKRSSGQSATVTFARSGDLSGVLKVKYALGGSLVSGKDYATLTGTKKIKAGKSSGSIEITPLATGASGKVKLTLVAGKGYSVGSPAKVQVKIK